jgi:hypothetical protein
MPPTAEPLGSERMPPEAPQGTAISPDEAPPAQRRRRWGRSGKKHGGRPQPLEHPATPESLPAPESGPSTLASGPRPIASLDEERSWKHRASLSTITGAIAVLVYMIVVTPPLLAPHDSGNPFFLILGAIVLFFVAEMFVSGVADLAVWLARWLEPPPERAATPSQEENGARPMRPAPAISERAQQGGMGEPDVADRQVASKSGSEP